MHQPHRPLPDCLTRLLDAPVARPVAPTPGDRVRVAAPVPAGRPPGRALEGVVLWALVYNIAGFVWLGILWQALRWLTR